MASPTAARGRYAALLERLYAARRHGVVFGLDRIRACLARMGDPARAPAVRVHVGGTNGKGSTVAFVDAIARVSGRRTGVFTSPHLSQLRERFAIDGAPAPEDAVVDAADAVVAAGGGELPFFEQVTAIALRLFADAGVDTVILEVGLGGRLDATNAVDAEVAAVTGAALDHQEYLGDTVEAIAREKAAIFKPCQRAVIGCAGEAAAVPVLIGAARAAGVSALTVIGPAQVDAVDAALAAGAAGAAGGGADPLGACTGAAPAPVGLGLAGEHQRANAACALAIADHLAALGHATPDPRLRALALAGAWLPGRMEVVAESPRVIADGAHNPHGAAALASALAAPGTPAPVVVLAVSHDKDVAGVVRPLVAIARAVVTTRYAQPRALPAEALAQVVSQVAAEGPPKGGSWPGAAAPPVLTERTVAGALARARALAGPRGLVVAAGSLFLVGEVRQHLLGVAADPIAVTDPVEPGPPRGPK